MRGEIIIFDGAEWRVLSHKDSYLKVIEMADVIYPRIKAIPLSKVKFRDEDIKEVLLPEGII